MPIRAANWARRSSTSRKSAAVFREIGHIRGWGGATMMRAWAYEAQGDFERALSYADSVNAAGEEASDPQVRAWGLLRRGASKRHLGRAEEAIMAIWRSRSRSRSRFPT